MQNKKLYQAQFRLNIKRFKRRFLKADYLVYTTGVKYGQSIR